MKEKAGKTQRSPVAKRYLAVALYKKNKNYSMTGRMLGVKPDFVRLWVERDRTGDGLLADAPRSGRPRKFGAEKTKELCDLVADQGKQLYSALDYHNEAQEKGVSVKTFKRALRRGECRYAAPENERILTPAHISKRYAFAKKYHDGGPWRSCMFTDSTYIQNGVGRKRWVPKGVKNIRKHYKKPDKLHIYSAVTRKGRAKLYFATGTTGQAPWKKGKRGVTAVEYQAEVVEGLFIPASTYLFARGEKWSFVQDGAPAHTAKSTKKLVGTKIEGWIQDWPPNSCDLNPIENVWEELKRRLRGKNYATVEEFKAAARKAWDEIPQTLIQKNIDSMRRRLRAVVKAKGGNTKY